MLRVAASDWENSAARTGCRGLGLGSGLELELGAQAVECGVLLAHVEQGAPGEG